MNADFYQERYHVLHSKMPMFGSGLEEGLGPIAEAYFYQLVGHRTIAQLIGHIVAWRKNTSLRFRDLPRPKIDINSPEDWPDYWAKTKAEMLAELAETKEAMLLGLAEFDYTKIDEKLHLGYYYTFRHALDGAVQHGIYHLGQINLIAAVLRRGK